MTYNLKAGMSIKDCFVCLSLIMLLQAGCDQKDTKTEGGPSKDLPVSASGSGFDAAMLKKIDTAVTNGTYPNIHSLLIARHGKLVYESYWPGKDESWGRDLGVITHSKDSLHDIRSISKSIVSACVGIAVQQGKIKSVDQKIMEFFPGHEKLDTGLKSLLTIKHLLSMSSGLVWNEEVPYDNPENSEIKMIRSADPVEYVLSQPMEATPGKIWKYNGGTTQLLAAIIEKTTGKKIDSFANENLFQPLGIMRFEWAKYPGTNLPAAASGLRLRSRDLLNFAFLYDKKGKWNDKQLIPEKWIEESFQPQVQRPDGGAYGYQFWMWDEKLGDRTIPVVTCVGNGDQRIFFDNANDLLVVMTAGNYNKWDIKNNTSALLRNYIYPALFNGK
jgi:CubicO group peptidase (beta-lactamase class C family)